MADPIDPWHLDPKNEYLLERDVIVQRLMKKLGVPNLFAHVQEFDAVKVLVAFDNHPTHWIVFRLWKGAPDYSPNHVINKLVKKPEPNGLLFEAVPKSTVNRETMEIMMTKETQRMEAPVAFAFSQLPPR